MDQEDHHLLPGSWLSASCLLGAWLWSGPEEDLGGSCQGDAPQPPPQLLTCTVLVLQLVCLPSSWRFSILLLVIINSLMSVLVEVSNVELWGRGQSAFFAEIWVEQSVSASRYPRGPQCPDWRVLKQPAHCFVVPELKPHQVVQSLPKSGQGLHSGRGLNAVATPLSFRRCGQWGCLLKGCFWVRTVCLQRRATHSVESKRNICDPFELGSTRSPERLLYSIVGSHFLSQWVCVCVCCLQQAQLHSRMPECRIQKDSPPLLPACVAIRSWAPSPLLLPGWSATELGLANTWSLLVVAGLVAEVRGEDLVGVCRN